VEVQPTEAWDENTMAVANTRERKKSKGTKVDVQATPSIKVNSCWYAVDPENNLPNTRATMQGFLEPYTAKYKWRGYIGEAPPPADIKSYHDSCDLFIYCGHGAGEKLIDSKAIKKSTTCPASLLWGCSSGKLVVHGIHDPVGAALSYLIGGAPYVLGNLWDVTDKDIDRLTIQCMSSYLDSVEESEGIRKDTSICDSLVKARDCCKLKYAVGSAPIIYGISLPLK
jgi:separase